MMEISSLAFFLLASLKKLEYANYASAFKCYRKLHTFPLTLMN
jgi:hypothetical protein